MKVGDLVKCKAIDDMFGLVVAFIKKDHGQPPGWGYSDDVYEVRLCDGFDQVFPFLAKQLEEAQ